MINESTYEELKRENEILRQNLLDKNSKNPHFIDKFINTAPLLFYIYDIEENRNIYSNDSFNIFGYSVEEIINFGNELFAKLLHPDDLPKAFEHHQNICNKNDDNIYEIEYRFKHKNGNWLILHSWDTCFMRNKDGNVKQISGVVIENTARYKAEQALQEAEWKFRALFEKGPIGVAYHVMINDSTGKPIDYFFLDANESYRELTGVDPRGKLVTEAFPGIENDPFDWIGVFGKVARTGETIRFEQYLESNQRWYDCVGYQYKPDHFVAAFLEITKRKQAEIQLQEMNEKLNQTNIELLLAKDKVEESDQLKTAFLQNMSHEIRTPMNAIIGFTGFLDNPDLSIEKRKSFTSIIQNSTNQLLSIITDILSISAIETKQEKASIDKVCINNIIVDLLAIFKTQALTHNISLYAKQQLTDIQSNIYTDKTKVTQILTNLITNALKFTHEGFIEFGYILKNEFIEFYVKDSGIGIKTEMQEKIFERFRQANENINKQYGGTGLGLAISKAFAELLGGKIWVQSELEKGSTFYFTIPYKPVYEIDKSNSQTTQIEDKITILIAEDEEYNFLYLEELLNNTDIQIIHTKDGKETVEYCRQNPIIDLILMDIKMPIMTGHEAAKQIKDFRPDLIIIAQSAYALEHERVKYSGTAFDDYITKPINKDKLKQILTKYIDKQIKKWL